MQLNHPQIRQLFRHNAFRANNKYVWIGAALFLLLAVYLGINAAYQKRPVVKASHELTFITRKIRALYATSAMVDPESDMVFSALPVAQSGRALTYIEAGIFPPDSVHNANLVVNPWGGSLLLHAGMRGNEDHFIVMFTGVPAGDCPAFIVGNAGDRSDPLLLGISLSSNTDVTAMPHKITPPVSQAAAREACGQGDASRKITVGFEYRLKAPN